MTTDAGQLLIVLGGVWILVFSSLAYLVYADLKRRRQSKEDRLLHLQSAVGNTICALAAVIGGFPFFFALMFFIGELGKVGPDIIGVVVTVPATYLAGRLMHQSAKRQLDERARTRLSGPQQAPPQSPGQPERVPGERGASRRIR